MMKYTKGVMNFLFPGRSGLWCEVAFAMEAWKHCVTLTMKTTRQTQGRMHTREERTPNPTDRQTTDKGRAGGTPKAREPPHTSGGQLARSAREQTRRFAARVHTSVSPWSRRARRVRAHGIAEASMTNAREHDECARAELSRRPSELALPPRRGIAKLQADR